MKKIQIIYLCIFLLLAISTTLVFAVNFDFNNDGIINITDLQNLASHYHSKATYNSTFDLNNDSSVNLFDIVAIAKNINATINGYFSSFISDTPQVITTPLYFAYPGIEYNIRPGVIAGRYPYTFSLTTKPSGMTMNSTTGEISWVPSTGLEGQNSSVNYTVTDSAGRTTYQNFTINSTAKVFYFVASNGSDGSGNGSIDNPWLTLNYSIHHGGLGNILYFRNGTYTLPNSSGILNATTINKWIAYPGEHPLIDFNFTILSPTSYYGLVDGFEITNMQHWAFSFDSSGGYNFTGWIFRRNTIHDLYDDTDRENPSFVFTWNHDAPAVPPYYTNFTIQNNTFYNLVDRGSGLHGDTTASYHGAFVLLYDAGYFLLEENNVSQIDGAGLRDKDNGRYNTFRKNFIYNTYQCGIDDLSQGDSIGDEILYNIVINAWGQSQGGNICGVSIGGQPGNISNISVHHNTFIGHAYYTTTPVGGPNSSRFYNNIVFNFNTSLDTNGGARTSYLYDAAAPSDYKNSTLFYRDYNVIYHDQPYIAGIFSNEHFTNSEWLALGFDIHSTIGTIANTSIFTNLTNFSYIGANLKPLPGSAPCGAGRNGDDIGAVSCS